MSEAIERVILSDLEGTLIAGEIWRGVGRYLRLNGQAGAYRWFLARQTPALLLNRLGLSDKQSFRGRWMEGLTRLLAGQTRAEISALGEWVVEHELWPQRRAAVLAELAQHRAAGCRLVLASGAYTSVLEAFARRIGDRVEILGTPLEFINERATGRFAGPLCVGGVKAERAKAHAGSATIVAAYGDTASDAEMLALSQQPIAVAPDAALATLAGQRGWRILPG
jgi:HAD superfamily phosphoserine phosphatase-like hydrolase